MPVAEPHELSTLVQWFTKMPKGPPAPCTHPKCYLGEGVGVPGSPPGVHLRGRYRIHAVAACVLCESEQPAATAQLQHDTAAAPPALRPLQLVD